MTDETKSWGEQALDIAREILPELSQEQLWNILWNETGLPSFWHGEPATCLRQQLEDYKRYGPIVDLEEGRRRDDPPPPDGPRRW